MLRFDTPQPIVAALTVSAGTIRVGASARADTVVEVHPSSEASSADVQAAKQTRVEYAKGKLLVKTPRSKTRSLLGGGGSIRISIDLPDGSELDANSGSADVDCEGRLGRVKVSSASGDIRIERTAELRATAANGDITATRIEGHADVRTAAGDVRIGEIEGSAVVKTASGDSTIGQVSGDLRLSAASGEIRVDRALASVGAKTASGDIRIGEVVTGVVVLETASGGLEIGIREGTAAWLDVSSLSGTVRNALQASHGPTESDQRVEIRARTVSGDITVGRV